MSVTVYGASDDLIEVEGGIEEEFNVYDTHDPDKLLAFSDGTVLRVRLTDDEVWRIETVQAGSNDLSIVQAPEGDGDNYSDRAVLAGPIRWVVLGTEFAIAKDGQ
ncbi:MAG: hypothetical protein ACRDQH_02500 [Pseudonocardiaceae bacterium]